MTSRLRDRGNVLRASIAPCVEALEGRRLLSAAVTNAGGAPNAPFALTASANGPGQVQVSFVDSADNETAFVFRRAVGGSGVFAGVATLPASSPFHATLTYTDTDVVAGTSYAYEVVALNGPYSSSTPAPVTATTTGGSTTTAANPGGAPNAPFGLTAVARPAGGATFSFYDSATNETGFVVERASGAGGPFVPQATLLPSDGSGQQVVYDDTSAQVGLTYFYRACAVNGPYASSTPAPVSATVVSSAYPPGAPNNVTAVATGPTTIQVSFTSSSNDATRFYVVGHYQTDGTDVATVQQVAAVGQRVFYTNAHALPGVTYTYSVRAENDAGVSDFVTAVSVTTPTGITPGTVVLDPTFAANGDLTDANLAGAKRVVVNPATGAAYVVASAVPGNAAGYTGPVVVVTGGSFAALNGTRLKVNAFLREPITSVTGLAIQSDGKLVLAGNSGGSIVVARFNADGSLDTTFGNSGGEEVVDYGGGEQVADVAVGPGGTIYVGGSRTVYRSTAQEFFAVRLKVDGLLDRSYGFDGISKGDPHPTVQASAMAIDPTDGSVVIVGTAYDGDVFPLPGVEGTRLLANGSAVDSFNFDRAFSGGSASDVLVQPDGKIVVAGTYEFQPIVQRFNADGSVDPTWVGPGAGVAASQKDGGAYGIARLADGSYVVAGGSGDFDYADTLILHLRSDGSVDPTAGGASGFVTQHLPDSTGAAHAVFNDVAVAADGAIYAAGAENGTLLVGRYRIA